ncbi:MAG: hypothetical protein R3F07_03055 [Opitutaceae bacterium]
MKKLLAFSLLFFLSLASAESEDPVPELGGTLIKRPDDTFLQLLMEGNRIHIYFFDKEKKPISPDVDRITIRIRSVRDKPRFTVAVPFEGINGLRAPFFVKPPHIFIAYLNLMRDGVEEPIETYVVNVGNATVGPDAAGMLPDGSSQP